MFVLSVACLEVIQTSVIYSTHISVFYYTPHIIVNFYTVLNKLQMQQSVEKFLTFTLIQILQTIACVTYCDTSAMIYTHALMPYSIYYDAADGSSSATFPAGTPGMACIDVTIIDNDVYEGEHDLQIHLMSVTPTLQTSAPTSVTITITDREGAHVCCFVSSCINSGY